MILDIFKRFFAPPPTGCLLDSPIDIEKAPRHELFAGGGFKVDWKQYLPKFRNQGSSMWCTAYTNTSIASALNKQETGQEVLFSPLELFYRTGGQLFGNYLISTAQGINTSCVLEENKPTPLLNSWGSAVYEKWKSVAKAEGWMLDQGKKYRTKSHAIVNTDDYSLRQALMLSPLSIAIPTGRGYWDAVAPKTGKDKSTHNVVLVDILDDGSKVIFDSLSPRAGFDGYHVLAPDYEILMAISFIDLPNDWEAIQEADKQSKFEGALAHYGKKRNLKMEQLEAQHLSETLKFHPTLRPYFGKDWTVCVNALAYGGYTVIDLLNHYTSIRRGQGPIFDLNISRY